MLILPVPVPILTRFEAILEKRSVAPIQRADYVPEARPDEESSKNSFTLTTLERQPPKLLQQLSKLYKFPLFLTGRMSSDIFFI